MEAIQSQIISNISVLKEKSQGSAKIVLILDNVDLLLATLPSLDIFGLSAMLLSLREVCHFILEYLLKMSDRKTERSLHGSFFGS